MNSVKTWMGVAPWVVSALMGCSEPQLEPLELDLPARAEKPRATPEEPFEPIPLTVEFDVQAAAIGERLFADPILSDDGRVKCTDCHNLGQYGGSDGQAVPALPGRKKGLTNSTTVFNVALFFRYGWVGAHDDMEHHLDAPMRSARVMGIASWKGVVERLQASATYRPLFEVAYPGSGVTEENVRNAIAEYQRSLITPNSPFDQELRGIGHAGLSKAAQEGYENFRNLGCVTCHQGIGLGGNMFQRFGVMRPYPATGNAKPVDRGLYRVTNDEDDMFVFRVPSLRNVAVTSPYFHDGSVASLWEAVNVMGMHQLGRDLTPDESCSIVYFLRSLTGEWQGKPLEADNDPGYWPCPDPDAFASRPR